MLVCIVFFEKYQMKLWEETKLGQSILLEMHNCSFIAMGKTTKFHTGMIDTCRVFIAIFAELTRIKIISIW